MAAKLASMSVGLAPSMRRKASAAADEKWVYAEVVAGFAAVTVLVYAATYTMSFHPFLFAWEWILL